MNKIIASFLTLCFAASVFSNSLFAEETGSAPVISSLINNFNETLIQRGWSTDPSDTGIKAHSFSNSHKTLNIIFYITNDKNGQLLITVNSEQNGIKSDKTFLFKKNDNELNKEIESLILPYLVSLTFFKNEIPAPPVYHSWLTLGYYRTNDNNDLLPDTDSSIFLVKWEFTKDPLKNITGADSILTVGDFLDSSFSLSLYPKGEKAFDILDEFDFNIEILVYGRSKSTGTGNSSLRNLYGWFTNIAYYRPYIYNDAMQWEDELYRDHVHVQYCYWTPASFMQYITRTENGRSLFLSYEVGFGPSQNSSLTATDISDDEAGHYDDRIFVSHWYKTHGFPKRRHNYYWSMAIPAKITLAADKYLNSKLQLSYEFYYFQSVFSGELYDLYNKAAVEYGYYITENITAGFSYEFHYAAGNSDQNTVSPNSADHSWNRFNIQVEMKI